MLHLPAKMSQVQADVTALKSHQQKRRTLLKATGCSWQWKCILNYRSHAWPEHAKRYTPTSQQQALPELCYLSQARGCVPANDLGDPATATASACLNTATQSTAQALAVRPLQAWPSHASRASRRSPINCCRGQSASSTGLTAGVQLVNSLQRHQSSRASLEPPHPQSLNRQRA